MYGKRLGEKTSLVYVCVMRWNRKEVKRKEFKYSVRI